ncbi:MAG: hypothetical protein DCC68_04035 [Planctomycetota bacterium]|nr:MAG: hypothetical protein DCC68_04035 [Planctomycetota bacterium]
MHLPDSSQYELEAEFDLRGEEIRKAFLVAAKHNGSIRRAVYGGWIIIGAFAAACLLLLAHFATPREMVCFAVMFLAMGAIFPFVAPGLLLARSRDKTLSAVGPIKRVRIAVTRDEIVLASDVSRGATALRTVTLARDRDFLTILFSNGNFSVVPRGGNFGRESFDTFCDKLNRLIDAAKLASAGNPYGR